MPRNVAEHAFLGSAPPRGCHTGRSEGPARDAVLLAPHRGGLVGQVSAPVQQLMRVLDQDAHPRKIVCQMRSGTNRACHHQLAQVIDEEAQHLRRRLELEGGKVELLGRRHQPDAGPDHDAQIGLREQPVDVRPRAPLVGVAHGVVARRPTAGLEQTAIGKHDIYAAQAAKMICHRSQAAALVQGIADHARKLRAARRVGPQT